MKDRSLLDLLRIGLTEGEAKVYLALLEQGSSTVGPIVKKSGVAYSNVYTVLDRLIKKGLTSIIVKSKTKYFQPASPSNLYQYLEGRELEISSQKQALKKVLPELERLQKVAPTEESEMFIGIKGLRSAYAQFLSDVDPIGKYMFFYVHQKEYATEADRFYFSIKDVLKNLKGVRGICNLQGKDSAFNKQATFIEFRYVDFPIPGNIEIYKDRVLLVSWQQPAVGILVRSKSLSDSLSIYFESVWRMGIK